MKKTIKSIGMMLALVAATSLTTISCGGAEATSTEEHNDHAAGDAHAEPAAEVEAEPAAEVEAAPVDTTAATCGGDHAEGTEEVHAEEAAH